VNILTVWSALKTRDFNPELMDIESCDPYLLKKTFLQFALINKLFSASRYLITRYLFSKMEEDLSRPYTLLDLGAGGGDIAVWVVKKARKRGINLSVTTLDRDECALSIAREVVNTYPEIRVCKGDLVDLPHFGEFDFIFCNHLLHHLTWAEIGTLIKNIEKQTKISFLLNDLKRSVWAYIGYALFAKLFLSPSFAYTDGLHSIRKGFIGSELDEMLNNALPGVPVNIIGTFPARLALYRCKI
jgi:2-polyprenyl-3-methyl-5-hydroxy-6-metoxy-1,4-benzoquinol methylase